MRTVLSPFLPALAAVLLLGACAHNPAPATPAPQAAPAAPAAQPSAAPAPAPARAAAPAEMDLSGDWNFVADFPGQRMAGLIQLRRSGTGYVGTATPADAEGSATLTSLTISGTRIEMVFDSPDGEARAVAVLADPKTMNGTVTYGGSTGPFTARRQ
jgi:hypothetical protein